MKKNNLWNYIFALGAFVLVGFLALAFNSLSTNELADKPNKLENTHFPKTNHDMELVIVSDDKSTSDSQSLDEKLFSPDETSLVEENNSSDKINTNKDVLKNSSDNQISVNKIVISKYIDNDTESTKYREPIDEYQTITTMHSKVIKNINYYPSFFVWTSINTENVTLKNENNEIEPLSLSLVISNKGQEIKKMDYNITAATPRWREWIEVDLTAYEEESIEGTWDIKIINNDNQEVLESRSFKLITPKSEKQEATAELKTKL